MTTSFVPKDVAIKMNFMLYKIPHEQIDNKNMFCSYFLIEHMFWIFVRIASLRRF